MSPDIRLAPVRARNLPVEVNEERPGHQVSPRMRKSFDAMLCARAGRHKHGGWKASPEDEDKY